MSTTTTTKTAKLDTFSRIRYEVLFWWHFAIWVPVLVVPFFVPLWAIVIGYIIYQLHLFLFQGCVITLWQQKHNIIPPDMEYYQAMGWRVFRYKLNDMQVFWLSRAVEYYVLITAVIVYLVKH